MVEPFITDHLLVPALTRVKQLAMVEPPQVVQKPSFDSFQVPSPLLPEPIGSRFILPSAMNVILYLTFDSVDAVNGCPLKNAVWISLGGSLAGCAAAMVVVSRTAKAAIVAPRRKFACIASPQDSDSRLHDNAMPSLRPLKNLSGSGHDTRCSAACRWRKRRGS